MFEDRRTAPYSIHQIALMGASEGKDVGEWFGPNTVAQVLRYALEQFSPSDRSIDFDNSIDVMSNKIL